MKQTGRGTDSPKFRQLKAVTVSHDGSPLTTNQGAQISDDREILRAGTRGPALLQDFIVREKLMHFDHERIPERVVHARGTGAHGYFQPYRNWSDLTKAAFLSDPSVKTPVFVRFSTVAGFRGSADTVRDVRGFAIKFYTTEGNYDLVGNNMPVFFIHDAAKFPDLIHALKPEPSTEIPQASSAHDTFWDFVSHNPETAHNLMWLMSDRALPRSYRTMEGFGIHTFRFVNARGESRFVKFHLKPLLGVHSLSFEEVQRIAGCDPDFNRRDLIEAIDSGNFPEWEFAVQVLDPRDEFRFDFDILDSTKLWPEEQVPLLKLGKLVLNRNVTDFFAETEQVAFCPANLVPGIEVTNDPLLQGRLFSYLDTQLSRLGGPNFHEIPINRPIVPVSNNQRDGAHRTAIDDGTAYLCNDVTNGLPHAVSRPIGEHPLSDPHDPLSQTVTRHRPDAFLDYYSQASLFYNSLAEYERRHIQNAFAFELGKCLSPALRQEMIRFLDRIDGSLAETVALRIGAVPPQKPSRPASALSSPALSMANTPEFIGKKVAILLGDGFDGEKLSALTAILARCGAVAELVATRFGIPGTQSFTGKRMHTFDTTDSVLFDAVVLLQGSRFGEKEADAIRFVNDAYRHAKPIGVMGKDAESLLLKTDARAACIPKAPLLPGVVLSDSDIRFGKDFAAALRVGRFWIRECPPAPEQP